MRTIIFLGLLCTMMAALMTSQLDAQTPRTPIQIDPSNDGVAHDPVITMDGGNIFAAWVDTRNLCEGIYLTRSTDNGKTFSAEIRLDTDILCFPKSLEGNHGRSLIVDGLNVYIYWYDQRNAANDDVYFAYSHDGGSTFTEVRIDDSGLPGEYDTQEVRMAANGLDVVIAMRVTDVLGGGDDALYASWSNDGGMTFSAATHIGHGIPGDDDVDGIAIDGFGSMAYVVFVDNNNGTDDVYGVSVDSSGTIGSIQRIATDAVAAGNVESDPAVVMTSAADIHVTWQEERISANEELYYNRSTDGGVTFQASEMQIGQYTPGTDDVDWHTMTGDGSTVLVTWRDDRNGPTSSAIWVAGSFDGGVTWSPDINVSAAAPLPPSIPKITMQGPIAAVNWSDVNTPDESRVAWSRDGGVSFNAAIDVSNSAADVDQTEVAVDTLYNSCHVIYLDDVLGVNNVYTNAFRSANLTLVGDLVSGHPHQFHIEGCVVGESGSPALFQCVLANNVGSFPIPGDGRDVGLPYDTLFKQSLRYGSLLSGAVAIDGSGNTPTFPLQITPGTYYSVGIVRLPGGNFGSITDPIQMVVTP